MRTVFLDLDGTLGAYLYVIVAAPTGVRYRQQCAGVVCEERALEGYLVPVAGPQSAALTAVFHRGRTCDWKGPLAADRLDSLRALVAQVPFWTFAEAPGTDERGHLELDESRLAEITEAWAPVTTPVGPGVLVWNNCD